MACALAGQRCSRHSSVSRPQQPDWEADALLLPPPLLMQRGHELCSQPPQLAGAAAVGWEAGWSETGLAGLRPAFGQRSSAHYSAGIVLKLSWLSCTADGRSSMASSSYPQWHLATRTQRLGLGIPRRLGTERAGRGTPGEGAQGGELPFVRGSLAKGWYLGRKQKKSDCFRGAWQSYLADPPPCAAYFGQPLVVPPRSSGWRRYWKAALEAGVEVVSITSYNEWGEGTQVMGALPVAVARLRAFSAVACKEHM